MRLRSFLFAAEDDVLKRGSEWSRIAVGSPTTALIELVFDKRCSASFFPDLPNQAQTALDSSQAALLLLGGFLVAKAFHLEQCQVSYRVIGQQ